MSIPQALILGIIQGLTEFLPVSSSGHLELAKAMMSDSSIPQESLLFTVVVHAATAISTLVIFRKDVSFILKGLLQFKANDSFFFSLKIIISMIPAAVVGILFDEQLEQLFSGQVLLVGVMLIVTGSLLFLADKAKTSDIEVSYLSAFIIGVSQAIAILPGISRSGATISTSVLLKIDRNRAARFSFLMVVPLILGKMAKDIMSGEITSEPSQVMPLLVGFIGAFITGLIACQWMISLVRHSKLKYFSIYCFIIGAIAIGYELIN